MGAYERSSVGLGITTPISTADVSATAPKTLDPRELVSSGILQEANRRFFHPLGLALMVTFDDTTQSGATLTILDSRDDPEGFFFADLDTDDARDKERAVTTLAASKFFARCGRTLRDPASGVFTIVQKVGTRVAGSALPGPEAPMIDGKAEG